MTSPPKHTITGRCYCGGMTVHSSHLPVVVSYCHCSDCRRLSGAPIAAFAAFSLEGVQFEPALDTPVSHTPGVLRWFCTGCGSPLAATYDYLPGQIYIPLGLIDQAAQLPPVFHSHADSALPWLHIVDDLERHSGSGREALRADRAPE